MEDFLKESMNYLAHEDGQVGAWLEREYRRQQENIELIASENITSMPPFCSPGIRWWEWISPAAATSPTVPP